MTPKFISLLCLFLALVAFLPSCSSAISLTEEESGIKLENEQTKEETEETAIKEEEKMEEHQKTEEKGSALQKTDPTLDDTVNVLMIGNSFCYYYVEELYEIAKAAGIKMQVCNLYYSGCKLKQHWEWYRGDERNYNYYFTDENGRRSKKSIDLMTALRQENWDVISLQQHFGTNIAYSYDECLASCIPYDAKLFNLLKGFFPMSKLYWHQTWAYEVGYNRSGGPVNTAEDQNKCYQNIRAVSQKIAANNNVSLIPSGDAWQIARANPAVGDKLCARLGVYDDEGDQYHDGDIGGGQYLNACVWFEVLTKKSCIGNPWRPDYALDFEKIPHLQKAAHEAVSAIYGENYTI